MCAHTKKGTHAQCTCTKKEKPALVHNKQPGRYTRVLTGMCIDDAGLAREGAINGQRLSASGKMEITGRRERWRQSREREGNMGLARMMVRRRECKRKWDRRDGEKNRRLKKGEAGGERRNCMFSLRVMNRVLIDPETEAIIPAQWAQQLQGNREGRGGGDKRGRTECQRSSETFRDAGRIIYNNHPCNKFQHLPQMHPFIPAATMLRWGPWKLCLFFHSYLIDGDVWWFLSCDKRTNRKSLWTKASAECPKCKCKSTDAGNRWKCLNWNAVFSKLCIKWMTLYKEMCLISLTGHVGLQLYL